MLCRPPVWKNGCCEFDVATLRPTYRLLISVPGRSNAFAISERLGMDQHIVARARELVSAENSRFEDVVRNLEESRQSLEQERKEAQELSAQAQQYRQEAEQRAEKASPGFGGGAGKGPSRGQKPGGQGESPGPGFNG